MNWKLGRLQSLSELYVRQKSTATILLPTSTSTPSAAQTSCRLHLPVHVTFRTDTVTDGWVIRSFGVLVPTPLVGINWLTQHGTTACELSKVSALNFFWLVRGQPGRKAPLIKLRTVFTFTTFNMVPVNKKSVLQWPGKEIWTKGKSEIERLLASPQQCWDRLCRSPNLEMGTKRN